jgi:hypothetical protein
LSCGDPAPFELVQELAFARRVITVIIEWRRFPSNATRGGEMKIDTSKAGLRCRAKKTFRAHQMMIDADSVGTVIHEIDNLGRRMILVRWDGDSSLYVFPEEIEITNEETSR